MNWQVAIVILIIATAAVYVARRAMSRLRSFTANKSSCATGCGSCGDSPQKASAPRTFVQINRSAPTTHRRV